MARAVTVPDGYSFAPEPPKQPVELSYDQIRSLILETFPDAPVMLQVALAESTQHGIPLNPKAKNPGSSASGIFQITKTTWQGCEGDIFNAADNIACARRIYDRRGLQPWEASGPW